MAKLKIYTFPDLVLTQKAAPVQRVEKSYRKLADDMLETMYDAPGIGLAANQVGILERILVIDTDYDLEEEDPNNPDALPVLKNKNPKIIFNPEIIHREGNMLFKEGCLSVPEYTAEVKRTKKVKFQFQDIDGLTQVLSAEGLLAACIQHEMDHLDGKLFIDRLSPLKKEFVKKKLRTDRKEHELNLSKKQSASKKRQTGF